MEKIQRWLHHDKGLLESIFCRFYLLYVHDFTKTCCVISPLHALVYRQSDIYMCNNFSIKEAIHLEIEVTFEMIGDSSMGGRRSELVMDG